LLTPATPALPHPQEIVHPDQFWYTSGADAAATGPNVAGLLAVELFLMHCERHPPASPDLAPRAECRAEPALQLPGQAHALP
jgi:hypothetical protein